MPKKKTTTKNKGGRPSLWVNPEVLAKLVDEYFENETQPTLAGLAYSLGISRSTLYNYENKDEFLDIIKKARRKVEKEYEKHLVYTDRPTGVIFALKNMGWADRSVNEEKHSGTVIIERQKYGGKSKDSV